MSEGERAGETEGEQEKLGLRRGMQNCALEEGAQRVLDTPQRGDVGYWRGCGVCGGRSALVCSVCTVRLGGDLDLGLNLGCDQVVHETQTH